MAATIAVALVLIGAFAAGIAVQRHELTTATQQVAEQESESVVNRLRGEPLDDESLRQVVGSQESLIQVVDQSDAVLLASEALAGRAPLVPASGSPHQTVEHLAGLEDGRYVIVTASARTTEGVVVRVITAQSLEDVDTAVSTAVRLGVIGLPVLLLAVALISYWLTGRALAPVERMRRRVAGITASNLGERVQIGTTGDEIDRLGQTMNDMLGRIDESVVAQRRFVSDASHELRSPIASVRTIHEVARSFPETTDWPQLGSDVLMEVQRLEDLVDQLLAMARHDESPGRHETVNLRRVVESETERSRTVQVTTSLVDATIDGDAGAVARAIRNLIDNAERHATSEIAVGMTVSDRAARIVIEDDGPGIAEADRERVFDRFVRLDESRSRDAGGAGLGLSITRQIIHQHGGEVVALPSAVGARFAVVLPVASEPDSPP